MTASYFTETILRVKACLEENLQALDAGFVAYPHYPNSNGHLPYANLWFGRRGDTLYEVGSEYDDYLRTLNILLVLGHITEGYTGDLTTALYDTYLPTIYHAFYSQYLITSTTYPAEPTFTGFLEGARLTDGGWQLFDNTGIGTKQLGCLFTLQLPMLIFKEGN